MSDLDANKSYEIFHCFIQQCFFPMIKVPVVKKWKNQLEISDETSKLKRVVEAVQTIHNVKRDENSRKLLSFLKKKLQECFRDANKQKNSEYTASGQDRTRSIWKIIKRMRQILRLGK
ncbi:hypothetical protein HHI36_017561 [Cryptolaemus montrouzieri]|uniref:Uncharacterized protein n=1 Tax=Cryptolaemus montrouzieri TaxID=559131 RepID=A0ABD2NNC2_9CUCU